MQYFFLEKQSPLSQRWKVRQIAFDPRYRYLYYSAPVSQSELEAAAHATAVAELSGREEENVPLVTWRQKIKLTALDYMADEYAVPPTSGDFQEKILLSMTVTGYERKLEKPAKTAKKKRGGGLLGLGGSKATSTKSSSVTGGCCGGGSGDNTGKAGSTRGGGDYRGMGSEDPLVSIGARANRFGGFGSGGTQKINTSGSGHLFGAVPAGSNRECDEGGGAEQEDGEATPPPELPSMELHLEGYDPAVTVDNDEVEDAEENMFRDIELVPDSNPDELDADDDEDEEEEESEEDEVLKSPTTKAMSEAASEERSSSFYSFGSTRARTSRKISIVFRARNYDAFRIVSLRLRQALVRHRICEPLHHGLPPYDPRNGIAFATVPLHLRCQFRRLNDVVFYSFQHGHAVYVRHMREVRGLSGYLCITHDSVLLLQADGKCPRWVDLEDIVGIDYVLNGSHSFVSILAAAPMPDFLFIPIFPTYPLVSSFDAESAVEGVVGMLRRLLMQRLRADEDVSLAPLPKHEDLDADNASDVEDYDALCHICDLSEKYDEVFRYISQNGAGRPLEWKWDNSKTPQHFTYKKDLALALKRDEEEDSEEESDDEDTYAAHREGVLPAHRGHRSLAGGGGGSAKSSGEFMNASMSSAASFTAATITQLLAPPSSAAELRARERLRVTRTDPGKREMKRAQSPVMRPAPVTVAAVAAVAAGVTGASSDGKAVPPPVPSAKPESYGLVHARHPAGANPAVEGAPLVVPALKGARLPANAPAVMGKSTPASPTAATKTPTTRTTTTTTTTTSNNSKTGTRPVWPSTTTTATQQPPSPKGLRTGKAKSHHFDPNKGSSPSKHTFGSPGDSSSSSSSSGDDEEDDDVFDSEDVDDLLKEPSAGAFQTPPRRRRVSKLRKRCGAQRSTKDHISDESGEDEESSSSSKDEAVASAKPNRRGSRRTVAAAAAAAPGLGSGVPALRLFTATAVPGAFDPRVAVPASATVAAGNGTVQQQQQQQRQMSSSFKGSPPNSPQLHPAQPPSMPTPTLQATTKLATDFLMTASTEALPDPTPALPPASTAAPH